jgi:hypothetical protein
MADFPIYRLVKGSTLSFTEMDDNLRWLSANMSASVVTITGSTYVVGNLNVSNGITGSLFGTSSWAVSASWAPSTGVTAISSYIATGSITASVNNTNISASFRVTSGSNTLLNVTRDGFVWIGNGPFTNQGYQLDVQGTARITQALKLFSGGTAPANNYPLNAYASSGGIASFEYATNGFIQFVRAGAAAAIIRSSYAETYDLVINAGNSGTFLGMCLRPDGTGIKIGGDPTTITHINSAQLNIESTTRGFLPPRMTAPQRVAIVTPAQGLLVYDTGSATEGLWFYNSGSNPGWQEVLTNSGSQSISGSITASNAVITGTLTAQTLVVQTVTSSILYSSGSNIFGNSLSNTQDFTGSVRITGSLQLTGDAVLRGSGATSATTALQIQNSASSNLLQVRNDGFIFIGASSNRPWILPVNGSSSPFVSGTALQLNIDNADQRTTTGFDFLLTSSTRDYTSGNVDVFRLVAGFSPTSGTGTNNLFRINAIINQTGGANGITRGLYVNPTLTAAADWRSIEWSNNSGWGLYGAGTANNYLGGRLAIGTTNTSSAVLTVQGNVSASSFTGSLFGTSSWAVSASWAPSSAVSTISSFIATGSVTASVSNTDITSSFKVTSGSRTLLTLTNDSKLVIGTPGEFIDYQLEVSGAIKANGNIVVDSNQTIASSLYGTGQLLSGATDQPILYLDSTWNTSGNARGIEYNVTNTTSGASSKLLNLKVDSISMFNVSKAGAITTAAPSGYTAQPWKLGDATAGTVTPDTYIKVEINGQIYSIPALLGTP